MMLSFLAAAPPVEKNVGIVADLIEGNTIRGAGHYVGGGKGNNKFEWLRMNPQTGFAFPLPIFQRR